MKVSTFRWMAGSPWPRRCPYDGWRLELVLVGGTATYVCPRLRHGYDAGRAA